MPTFATRNTSIVSSLDWSETLKQQLAAILAATSGPKSGEPDAPTYGDSEAPHFGDFSLAQRNQRGDTLTPLCGDAEYPTLLGGPALGDWSPSLNAEEWRIRLRPLVPPATCGEDHLALGDEDDRGSGWGASTCSQGEPLPCCDEDEEDGSAAMKCGEPTTPLYGDPIGPMKLVH